MNNNIVYAAVVVFILAFILHSVPSLTSEYPVGLDSYYFLRIGTLMADSSFQLDYDPISFGGRDFAYPPGLPYVFGILAFFSDIETTGTFLTLIVGSLATVVFFLIGLKIMDRKAAFFSAVIFSMIPVVIWKTSSAVVSSTYTIFLFLLSLYFILNPRLRKFFVIPSIVLLLFSPAFSILIFIFSLFYLRKNKLVQIQSVVLLLGIVYSSLVFFEGFSNIYIYKDLPDALKTLVYPSLNAADFLYRINPIVFFLGLVSFVFFGKRFFQKCKTPSFWKALRRVRAEHATFFLLGLISALLLIFGFIEPDRGVLYLSVPLSLGSGVFLSSIVKRSLIYSLFALVIVFSLLLVPFAYNNLMDVTPKKEEIEALELLGAVDSDNMILSAPSDGHLVGYFSGKRVFLDGNLIYAPDVKNRFLDAETVFTTKNDSLRSSLLDKYNLTHVFFSRWEQAAYKTDGSSLKNDPNLEPLFRGNSTTIYRKMK